jgi:hypothetical protein
MAMWSAYYDASGTQTDPHLRPLVVAGVLSTVEGWLEFEQEWNAVLGHPDFNVPHMHYSAFKHSRARTPFEGWRGQEDRRAAFRLALVGVIAKSVARSLIVSTPLAAFNDANAIYRFEDNLGGAYSLAGSVCLGTVSEWVRVKHPGDRLRHWFERGDNGQDAFEKLARREGFSPRFEPNPDPETGEGFRPLEAADFMAGLYAEQLARENETLRVGVVGIRVAAAAWTAIARQVRCEVRYQTLEGLLSLGEKYPDLFPRRAALG